MLTENEALKKAMDCGIIDITAIYQVIEMNDKKKYLGMHHEKIWKASDGRWKTHLSDKKRTLVNKKTLEEVEQKIIEYYKSQEEKPCIENVFNEWIERKSLLGEIQPQTTIRYREDFNKFIKDSKLSKNKFCDITENQLEDYILQTIHDFNLTTKGWSNVRILIRGIFQFGKRQGYTSISITNLLGDLDISRKMFRHKKMIDKENIFTKTEMDMLIDRGYQSQKIQELAVVLALQTGLRAGEISALEWDDIFDNYIYVTKTEVRTRNSDNKQIYLIKDTPKTENGIRKVYFTDDVRKTIDILRQKTGNEQYVFSHKGRQMHSQLIGYTCKSMCLKIGIKPRSAHKCRKTYATNLINSNVDEKVIQSQLGHSDIATTKKYYYYNNKSEEEILEQLKKASSK